MYVPEGTDTDAARQAASGLAAQAASRSPIPALIATWEPIIGREVPRWSIRRMKTKWGSCNRETGHIWFNLELAKKHPLCLEYIVVQTVPGKAMPSRHRRRR